MRQKSLIAYLISVSLLSAILIAAMIALGKNGFWIAPWYVFMPALAAIITRTFFHEKKFKDAKLRYGKTKNYLFFWLAALLITLLTYLISTSLGAISWNFSSQNFIENFAGQFSLAPEQLQTMLPQWLSPTTLLIVFAIAGLTILNIIPGILMGFGEEFGWRGLLFPELYKIKPLLGFIGGGLIWFAWHIPLIFVMPAERAFSLFPTVLNLIILAAGSICTFIFLAYVLIKTESIFVTSFISIALTNMSKSFSYFAAIQNQLLVNLSTTITMALVILFLFWKKEFSVFHKS